MQTNLHIIDKIIYSIYNDKEIKNKDDFHKLKNAIYKEFKLPKGISSIDFIKRYNELVDSGELKYEARIHKIFRKRGIRSLSGISVISVLTKFWGCPGKCIYCPTYENLPKSYINNEPAVMRAVLNKFDPINQVHNRLRSLEITGHNVNKCDIRVIGGTWSFYPKDYKYNFIKDLYDAHSSYSELRKYIESTSTDSDKFAQFKLKEGFEIDKSADLEEAKRRNETAESRVIGIAIETRPDWVNMDEIIEFRKFGVTRVEIGYQTTIDEINELNKRGHGNSESIQATKMLKDAGFKVVAHMMPNLLGSIPELDLQSLKTIFENSDFRPDEIKIYPMVVTENSELTKIWREGGFKAYDDKILVDLMVNMQMCIPEYVRLNRMYRDIPATEILEGSNLANLRQIVDEKLKVANFKKVEISARELRDKGNNPENAVLNVFRYEASGGIEYFLTFEDPEDRMIFSLLRLRIPSQIFSGEKHFMEVLQDSAIIRELHTFGDQLKVGEEGNGTGQHMGFGKRLIQKAEEIVMSEYPQIKKIAIISGVGVREYYKKRGYELVQEYMVKEIN